MSAAGEPSLTLPLPRAGPIRWTAWLALISAGLAWMFDSMDLQIVTLVLFPAVSSLIGSTDSGRVAAAGGVIITCKVLAWGVGGIVFGVVTDRIGRARTMIVTVVIYSVFTGLSGFAQTWWQLALLQALAGFGIGGEWAAGAALVAETWPEKSRPRAMLVMQMCFGVGLMVAALLNLVIGPYGWRWVFAAGVAPAPLILILRSFVPESDRWLAVHRRRQAEVRDGALPAKSWSTLRAIFTPSMRVRTIVGVLITLPMLVVGPSTSPLLANWVHQLLPPERQAAAGRITSEMFLLFGAGGLAGYIGVIGINEILSRRWAYAVIIAGSALVVFVTFTQISTMTELLWFVPVYGFFVQGGVGFIAAYLPELFPTSIRATGQGFCWNSARAIASLGPFVSGTLVGALGSVPAAGRLMACVYLVGIVAIWFGPEMKGQPLQD
jgi:MFS family permease